MPSGFLLSLYWFLLSQLFYMLRIILIGYATLSQFPGIGYACFLVTMKIRTSGKENALALIPASDLLLQLCLGISASVA